MKTLIVMALAEEGGFHFENDGTKVIYTGLGKVNASYKLTRAICEFNPDLVINFGTAGSKTFKRGELVAINSFIQRDMDVSPLGYKKGQTPFEDIPEVIEHKVIFKDLPHGVCGTGDNFEIDHNHSAYNVVDMEAYAFAKICHFERINFGCVKYISDGADNNASDHWEETLNDIPAHFLDIYNQYFT